MSWIKMRSALVSHPTVLRLSKLTGLTKFDVIGRLFCFWSWADQNTTDGVIHRVELSDLQDIVGDAEFAQKLAEVGWLKVKKSGIEIPRYDAYNGDSTKKRMLKNQRQSRWRERKKGDAAVDGGASTEASTREEKKEKRDIPPLNPPLEGGTAADIKSARSKPKNGRAIPKFTAPLPLAGESMEAWRMRIARERAAFERDCNERATDGA